MPRALDHLVIAYRDLDAAAERYRGLGFQVGGRNRHPWGTENHIVQFDGAFLELIGLGAGFKRPASEDPVSPFAAFIADYLEIREGPAMLVLRSDNAQADRSAFAAKGLGERPVFDFARRAMRGGVEVEVAFTLAFAEQRVFPETGFFVCQQRRPENFWDRAMQTHPNGATGVAALEFAHPDPATAEPFLAAFLDAKPLALAGTSVSLIEGAPAGLRSARIALGDGGALILS